MTPTGAPCDLADDEVGFVALVERANERDRLAGAMRGAQRLAHAPGVGADHDVRQIENLRRRPIVLLEPDDRGVGKSLLKSRMFRMSAPRQP